MLGNLIGTTGNGSQGAGNGYDGVQIINSSNNVIGLAGARNVISGNTANGVEIDYLALSNGSITPATGNVVNGNFIGLARDGLNAVGNGQNGVIVVNATDNFIGQTAPGLAFFPGTNVPNAPGGVLSGNGNVISGNGFAGIQLTGTAGQTAIEGNYIGTTAGGSVGANLGNPIGVYLNNTGQTVGSNWIGADYPSPLGPQTGVGNLISQSSSTASTAPIGIDLFGPVQAGVAGANQIARNLIGLALDPTGTSFVAASQATGILINQSSDNNIGGTTSASRNVISGNAAQGIVITGLLATGNLVRGNFIGPDPNGTTFAQATPLHPVQNIGVAIIGAPGNTIGGATGQFGAAPGNVISGNIFGVDLEGLNSTTTVQGNIIGLDSTGLAALPNLQFGVFINGSPNQTIVSNLISANGIAGVDIVGVPANNRVMVENNLIGPNIAGAAAFLTAGPQIQTPNGPVLFGVQRYGVGIIGSSGNFVGDNATRPGKGSNNQIIGNGQVGVYITNTDFNGKVYARPVGNVVGNNTIGFNGLYGVLFFNSPNNQTPPVTGPGSKNIFRRNRLSFLNYVGPINGQSPQPIPKASKPHFPAGHKHKHVQGASVNTHVTHSLKSARVKGPSLFHGKSHTGQHAAKG